MKKLMMVFLLSLAFQVWAEQENSDTAGVENPDSTVQEYRIEKPGTITFTVGAKIKGKVEKPQVVIFLPKDRTHYQEITLERNFREDLLEPLPFVPLVK
jgi:hypothetical protein